MASAATRRIAKELNDLTNDPVPNVTAGPESETNLLKWKGTLIGPDETPYQGGKFQFNIEFPREYPFKAPMIKFTTQVYHMNVMEDGSVCIGILKGDAWKPSTKIDQAFRALVQLFQEPDTEDALVASIAEMYRNDREGHNSTAKAYTKKYAT